MMKHNSRLDSLWPSLAKKFREAAALKRQQATVIACELAVSAAGIQNDVVANALLELRCGGSPSWTNKKQLELLAAQLDDKYLRLAETGNETDETEMLKIFSQARATSALLLAFCEDSDHLHEAIYEAGIAMGDLEQFVRDVEKVL